MSRTIYKITVLKWNNHNSKHKDSFKKTLIANNFCGDAKVKVLPASVRWMFLGLLLLCGDMSKDTVEVADSSLRDLLGSGYSSSKALSLLQSFQLLTYEKIDFLRIEVKRNEVKRIEKKEKETAPDFIEVDFKSLEKENGPVKTIKPKHETFEVQIAELYLKIYPLKKGKTAGLKTLTKAIKTNEDLKNLETAILNYKKQIKNPEYTMHFSTFANQWKDWLDENAEAVYPPSPTAHPANRARHTHRASRRHGVGLRGSRAMAGSAVATPLDSRTHGPRQYHLCPQSALPTENPWPGQQWA